jgi:hypothetical protein
VTAGIGEYATCPQEEIVTFTDVLNQLGRRGHRRTEILDAVYDDDLWDMLGKWGLLEPLDRGELSCAFTGVPLTRDNLGGIVTTAEGPKLVAEGYLAEHQLIGT